MYDKTGKQYHQGAGLSVYVNGNCVLRAATLAKQAIKIPENYTKAEKQLPNLAINLNGKGFPKASASFADSSSNVNMAADGRIWYFKDVNNHWSAKNTNHKSDWFEVAFDKKKVVKTVSLFFYGDNDLLAAPKSYKVFYWDGLYWKAVNCPSFNPKKLLVNTENKTSFAPVMTNRIRICFINPGNHQATSLAEIEVF